MMLRDPSEGWHYDHWFVAPKRRLHPGIVRAGTIALVCLLLAVSSIVAVANPW